MLSRLFSQNKKEPLNSKTPDNTVIYAVGDVHGCCDLLVKMYAKIKEDAENFPAERKVIVFLGDYIDRGFQTKEVLEYLTTEPFDGFETVFIKGNHEWVMEEFLNDPINSPDWLHWGGDAVIYSYGINYAEFRHDLAKLAEKLKEALPAKHLEFLQNLKLYHTEGDYVFVHAGIRPNVPLEKQSVYDLISIRREFFFSDDVLDKAVVFGHTIFDEPFYRNNRIGVDTGACVSGVLTAARLHGEDVDFISVK